MAGQPATVDAPSLEVRVRTIVFDILATDPERQADDAYLIDNLGADSLDVMEFEFELEEAFGLAMNELDLTRAITVSDVIAAVRHLVDARAAPAGAA